MTEEATLGIINTQKEATAPLIIRNNEGREILRLANDGTLTLDPQDAPEAAERLVKHVAYFCRQLGQNNAFASATGSEPI